MTTYVNPYRPRVDYRIRERRESLGLTQEQLGAAAGFDAHRCGQAHVSLVEQGKAPRWMVRKCLIGLALVQRQRLDDLECERRAAVNSTLIEALPDCEASRKLKAAILDRVCSYIWDEAKPELADALLEFVSEAEAAHLLDELFPDTAKVQRAA